MSDTALNAMKRTALVLFCLLLVVALGLVFTRVVAARVPEQRATLEKLITDRTGLAVRFENVHFAWGLDGTSAVFTRVELTDPKAGRVRVVAPELRVEFDTWDFLRHQQFSLGHVTLSSPDIEIIGDAEDVVTPAPRQRAKPVALAANDEAAIVRRVTSWAQLMPNGRIEVEGARVHLLQRGHSFKDKSAARRSFTLSQAVISRGASNFNAYGTMLLAQDVGQSLFVSAKLENLSAGARVSGELRVIARRVFLDKLPLDGVRGRGTLDARIALRDGRVDSGSWQASARELAFDTAVDGSGEPVGPRFDHLTVNGKLSRDAGDVLLELTDLQLTRGARLERAPRLTARLALEPGTTRIARTTVQADRMPFMAAELVAGVLAPQLSATLPDAPGGWAATAGELHDLRFDSGVRHRTPDAWTFSARMDGAEITRAADQARIAQLAARVQLNAQTLTLDFDRHAAAVVHLGVLDAPRPLTLAGRVTLTHADSALRFDALTLQSGDAVLAATGAWDGAAPARPLSLTLTSLDRTLLDDTWRLVNGAAPEPALLAQLANVHVVDGTMSLASTRNSDALEVDWPKSRGNLKLASLATSGGDAARLVDGRGTLSFARGTAQLRLTEGRVDDLAVSAARLDWPAQGAPHLTASLSGPIASPLLRSSLAAQGLDKLTGTVTLDAEARGEAALRQPESWRISARLDDASVPLAKGLPPLEKLAGTLRYADGQLRALSLDGTWLGGPVALESRRAPRGQLSLALNGTADAAPLLQLLGDDASGRVGGQLAWSGSALRPSANAPWQLSLNSNLVGLESNLPEPFDKAKSRALPLSAELRLDADGVREFVLDGRDFAIRGEIQAGMTRASFELPGVEGTFRRGADPSAKTEIAIDRLETRRAPTALVAAAALLPPKGELALNVADLRHADRSLGAVRATVARTDDGLAFSFDSAEPALHRVSAQGSCLGAEQRCRAEFTADTSHFAALLRGVSLPADVPAEKLHANGELTWPMTSADLATAVQGRFDLETEGTDASHQLVANVTLADGQLQLDNLQGTGPDADQVFRGSGRVGLVARDYDLTVDYERIAVATAAVPTPARARLARAWNVLRGSAARRGWTEAPPEARRVQWHGFWGGEIPEAAASR